MTRSRSIEVGDAGSGSRSERVRYGWIGSGTVISSQKPCMRTMMKLCSCRRG